jgi:histidyl-tRNA synthetase
MPAVGTTLGLDRIFTAMQQLNMLPEVKTSTEVLIANFSEDTLEHVISLAGFLRQQGIATEIYPDAAKLKKQFAYADKKGIPFMAVLGETEIADGTVALKNLRTGEQKVVQREDISSIVKPQ